MSHLSVCIHRCGGSHPEYHERCERDEFKVVGWTARGLRRMRCHVGFRLTSTPVNVWAGICLGNSLLMGAVTPFDSATSCMRCTCDRDLSYSLFAHLWFQTWDQHTKQSDVDLLVRLS